jgi:hypothetical protein
MRLSDIPHIELTSLTAEQLRNLARNAQRSGHQTLAAAAAIELDRRTRALLQTRMSPTEAWADIEPEGSLGRRRRSRIDAAISVLGLVIAVGLLSVTGVPELVRIGLRSTPALGDTRVSPERDVGRPAPPQREASLAAPRAEALRVPEAPSAAAAPGPAVSRLASTPTGRVPRPSSLTQTAADDVRAPPAPSELARASPREPRRDLDSQVAELAHEGDAPVSLDLSATRLALAASAPPRPGRCRGLAPAEQLLCEDAQQAAQDQRFASPFVSDVKAQIPRRPARR